MPMQAMEGVAVVDIVVSVAEMGRGGMRRWLRLMGAGCEAEGVRPGPGCGWPIVSEAGSVRSGGLVESEFRKMLNGF